MMRRDRSEPIQRRRQGPVIERAGQGSPALPRILRQAGLAAGVIGLFMLIGDGRLLNGLFSTFEYPSSVKTGQAPAPPRVEPPRAEAPTLPAPPLPRVEPPRPEVPISSPPPAPTASVPPQPRPAAVPPAAPVRSSLLVPRPPGAQPAIAPFADADVTQVVTKQIRRFNESRDVVEKQEASRQIHAAALIGHPLARSIIVSAYRTSTIVQNVSTPADVVRMALDFAPRGQGDSAPARSFAALADHLADKDAIGFGRTVLDAMRDDARLREAPALATLMDSLRVTPKACGALASVSGAAASGTCDAALSTALSAMASARGPSGQEEAAYRAAERAFARYLQEAF